MLVLHDVSKRYGRGPFVLDDLSYTFAPGTATALVGPNGSGKTTLLRLLGAASFPTSGRITYGERDVHAEPYRYLQHVGIVHAESGLPEYLSAVELLVYVLRARGRHDAGSDARIAGLLDRLRLDERREALIGTYSSGMLKKAQIAAALVAEPAVLLLDEPFRGLDEASTEAVLNLLRARRDAGAILILSSHVRATLEALCDAALRFHEPGHVTHEALPGLV